MKQAKRVFLSFLTLMLSTLMYAQTEISGTVVDGTGEAVIGATVMEKGTSNGTVTDFDGNFKLKVAAGKKLTVSYIGYQTQEVAAKNGMKVTLQDDALALNEVVVTWCRNVELRCTASLHHRRCAHHRRYARAEW